MTIAPGVYVLVNGKAGTALDLSGGDHRSIIGFNVHGGGNQQWKVEDVGNGEYTIQSVASGLYLTIDGPTENGTKVVASQTTSHWRIEHDNNDPNFYRLFVPGTQYVVDLSDHGNATPGTPVTLWWSWEGTNQTWRFDPVGA